MDRKTSIANGLAHENVGATSLFTPLDVAAAYTQDFVSQKNKYDSWDQFIVTWRRILKKKKKKKLTISLCQLLREDASKSAGTT